eukprot:926611-Amphidinium_carterae.1
MGVRHAQLRTLCPGLGSKEIWPSQKANAKQRDKHLSSQFALRARKASSSTFLRPRTRPMPSTICAYGKCCNSAKRAPSSKSSLLNIIYSLETRERNLNSQWFTFLRALVNYAMPTTNVHRHLDSKSTSIGGK